MSGPSTCTGGSFGAEIRRHFAGTISARAERNLRLHLAECAACRDDYERHLVLAEIDPSVPSAEERIGRGLGLRPHRVAAPWKIYASAAAACALALAIAVPLSTRNRDAGADHEFASR